MVIVKLDISNAFGSLCARLVLDVLSGKASRDYVCGIKVDVEFETAVYELRAHFGFAARTAKPAPRGLDTVVAQPTILMMGLQTT